MKKMLAEKNICCIFAVPNNEGSTVKQKVWKFFESLRPA